MPIKNDNSMEKIALDSFNKAVNELEEGCYSFVLCNSDGSLKGGMGRFFEVGELVTVKGNTFKVAYISNSNVILEPVPKTLVIAKND